MVGRRAEGGLVEWTSPLYYRGVGGTGVVWYTVVIGVFGKVNPLV